MDHETYDTPDAEEVYEAEPEPIVVPVRVDGTVRTDEMPTRSGGPTTINASTQGVKMLNGDPRRRVATIVSLDQDILIGNSMSSVQSGKGALWPRGVPLVLTNADEWWVAAVTGTTDVTVIPENWAR